MGDISPNVRLDMTGTVDVTANRGRQLLQAGRVFVKTKGDINNELDVYTDIDGKGIAPDLMGVIVDNQDDNKAIGFVQHAFEATHDTVEADLEPCKEVLKRLHEAGWLHMDPNKKNFNFINGRWYTYDFEGSMRVNDERAYRDTLGAESDEERMYGDLAKQKGFFTTGQGGLKKA
ncbi:alpha-galactosidase A precursor [Apiospora rasikravindrae]|uniref:Alpha-galactosidase A n=1 Tax=Apiospora rasikravindrae TaxID=990691 RepID=A0ABR1SPR4_9PEZI